jgi:hypothetical protein
MLFRQGASDGGVDVASFLKVSSCRIFALHVCCL